MAMKNPSVLVGQLRKPNSKKLAGLYAWRLARFSASRILWSSWAIGISSRRAGARPHQRAGRARNNGKLIGSNVVTRWGSFAFFGPLTILPDYWNRGVAQQLLAATINVIDRWGVRRSGLFTFPNSLKHVGLYQKFGYWPGYLTAIMKRARQRLR